MAENLVGGSTAFLGWGAGPHLTQSRLGRGLLPYVPCGILIHAVILPHQKGAENWGLCPLGRGNAGSPSNTVWPRPRPTCVPSFILSCPTVWPQCTNVTDIHTNRQTGQRSDSIGRTVLQTVANNMVNLWLREDVHTKHGRGSPTHF